MMRDVPAPPGAGGRFERPPRNDGRPLEGVQRQAPSESPDGAFP